MKSRRRNLSNQSQGFVVNLPVEVVVREIPTYQVKTSTIEVLSVYDNSSQKKIVANTKQLGEIVLWESDSYDRIGQWSDADVQTRLIELFLK